MVFIACQCCDDRHHIDLPEKFPHGSHTLPKLDTGMPQWEVKCPRGNGVNFVDAGINVTGTRLNTTKGSS